MNVYDFDKTIYNGDSTAHFYFYCLMHYPQILVWLPYQAWSFFLYVIGVYDKTQFKERFYKFFRSVRNIESVVERFWDKHICGIKKWYTENRRDDDVVISASPYFLLKPVCDRLNIKTLIASRVDCKTGKYTGLNCYGEEKVIRFREEIPGAEYDYFYSDSLSDTPLAKLALKKSYIVSGEKLVEWEKYTPAGGKKLCKMLLSREFLSFLVIGVVNTINGTLFSYIYSFLPFFNANTAFMAGYVTALTISYFLNILVTFRDKPDFVKYLKFVLSYIPNFIIQNMVVILVYNILHIHRLVAYILAAVIGVPLTYLIMKIFVFRKGE